MRISDWSSDVCSSDLQRVAGGAHPVPVIGERPLRHPFDRGRDVQRVGAEAQFGAIDVARHDRQTVVAIDRIAPEAEVAVVIDLPQPPPGGGVDFHRRLYPLVPPPSPVTGPRPHLPPPRITT